MSDYAELIKLLRDCAEINSLSLYKRGLMKQAADAIEELQRAVYFHKYNSEFWEDKYNSLADEKWIPVTERLPESGVDVLVMFPHNMAVASRDMGGWVVNSGDGWCTDVNISDDEKEPTHWMPLPEPPKEEATDAPQD